MYCFCGCAGIAAKRRKGCSPLLRQSRQYRSAGKLPCAEIKPSAERTRPLGCISAPLVPKGFLACRSLGSFSQKLPRWLARQGKPEKRGGFFVGHVLCFRHNAFKDPPRTIRRWLRVRRSSRDSFCRNIFSRFSYCRIFFFPSSISACSSSRVFSLGFVIVGRSFLLMAKRKEQPFQ